MPIKSWILKNMNRMNGVVGRADLPRRPGDPPTGRSHAGGPREPTLRSTPATDDASRLREHLGAYAPLVNAIRSELEHFVATQLRLHLAIAERDRYLLTSIDVECEDSMEGAELVRRFKREFTPEQIKRFLARDVIAHLPNASSIDLNQFGGLDATRDTEDGVDDPYAELVAQLRTTSPNEARPALEVKLVGRWTQGYVDAAGGDTAGEATQAAPRTPIAGSRLEIEIDDANGKRHVVLSSIVANRRYAIGKGAGCDIAVDGTFASRRHCEIWMDAGRWWAADAGSRNGVRVESGTTVLGRSGGQATPDASSAAIEIVRGAEIVLSALAQGDARDYPRVSLRVGDAAQAPATPLAPAVNTAKTPVTPIAAPLPRSGRTKLVAAMASGERTLDLDDRALPVRVGRSRNQHLVVDWAHEGVSGHHVDIVALQDDGAEVDVHGDNGVTVGGATHAPGQRFRWRFGERMTLGRASGDEPECSLVLTVGS